MLTQDAYARLVARALANPNSGIKPAPTPEEYPRDRTLYYSFIEICRLLNRSRGSTAYTLDNSGITYITGEQLGAGRLRTRFYLKKDVHTYILSKINPEETIPADTLEKQRRRERIDAIDLTTHTIRGTKRTHSVGHPGPDYYSTAEVTDLLRRSNNSLTYIVKKHALTVVKRSIFVEHTNQTCTKNFYLKKEIDALAKRNSHNKQ